MQINDIYHAKFSKNTNMFRKYQAFMWVIDHLLLTKPTYHETDLMFMIISSKVSLLMARFFSLLR